MQVAPVNPRPYLQELTGKMVAVKLKWGLEYRGFLVATDAYMNLQVHFLMLFPTFWLLNANVFVIILCASSTTFPMVSPCALHSSRTLKSSKMGSRMARWVKSSSGKQPSLPEQLVPFLTRRRWKV
jgi:LSM domain